jgi:hypothetical protein
MQMTGWQTLMRTAILCSRAEYFTDQHHASRQVPLGEWFVKYLKKKRFFIVFQLGLVTHGK